MRARLHSPLLGIFMLVFLFTAATLNAQQIPFHSYPSDGQANTYSLTPTIFWYNNDQNVGSYTYDLQVSTSNSVNGFGAFITPNIVNLTNVSTLNYQLPALSGSTTYYWHVRSKLGLSYSAWSTPWSFTTPGASPSFTITASAVGSGTITPSGAVSVASGSSQAFIITPTIGNHLDSLKVDGALSDSTTHYTFINVTTTHTITAYFSSNQFTITASNSGGFTIVPSGAVLVNTGSNKQFTFNVNLGYDLDSVRVDGVHVDSLTSYTFVNVLSAHTITAYFHRNNHVYVNASSGNDFTGDGSSLLPYATIQKAVDVAVPGQIIHVAAGTYISGFSLAGLNNLTITGAGTDSTFIIPSSVISTGLGHKSRANTQSIVFINHSTNIELDGMTIQSGSAAPDFGGPDVIVFWNASSGTINNCKVKGTYIISGSQSGQGIGVDAGLGETTTLSITNTVITGFQKNGIDAVNGNMSAANPGTIHLTVDGCTITGAGSTTTIAQNGILIWNKGGGTVTGSVNNTAVSGLIYSPPGDVAAGILVYGTAGTNMSSISNNVITGTEVGIDVFVASHLEIVNNLIKNNDVGVMIEADFSALTALDTPVVITDNSIFNNSIAGLDVLNTIGGPGAGDFYVIPAENNYWGSVNGPADANYFDIAPNTGTSFEMPAGNANPINQWVNLVPGSLGNAIIEHNEDPNLAGVYVDYYPWDGGTPALSLSDISSTAGATVSMNFVLDGKGSSFNTLQGKFTYDPAKLDFLNASYGTGTLINGSGWTILFSESTPGTVTFAGVGFTPINSDGILFKLNFEILDPATGSSSVTGNNTDFKANGSQIFGAVGSFTGAITYTHTPLTYLRGDVTLDGSVTLDDALLLQDKITNHNISSLSNLARQNADADLSSGDPSTVLPDTTDIGLPDVLAILQFVIDGNWPVTMFATSSGSVAFGDVSVDQNNLVNIPVSVNGASNIKTLELTVKYNENLTDYQSFSQLMKSSGNFVSSAKIADGVASFMYVSTKVQNGNITPGKIILKLEKGSKENLNITSTYKLNGGAVKQGPSYVNGVTSAEENVIPLKFEVAQNYPNPFNPSTMIKFGIPQASNVSIKIYDMLGQLVKTLVNEERNAGTYQVTWHGDNDAGLKVTSGAYIYRVVAGSNIQTMKMLLVK